MDTFVSAENALYLDDMSREDSLSPESALFYEVCYSFGPPVLTACLARQTGNEQWPPQWQPELCRDQYVFVHQRCNFF